MFLVEFETGVGKWQGMTIGPRPNGYPQKIPTMSRVKPRFYGSGMHLGLRMCLRDDVGGFVLAKTAWFSPLYDVRRGRSRRVAVDSFRTCVDNNGEFGCIMQARKWLFQINFQNSHAKLSRRQINRITHELVQEAPY
ncbi:hypothetical protein MTR_7g082130 [Medicago truncatula]|uniref:Uncharacterized protein n=1 Tax=Medicago truncatula TaxID=3880 RepID=G7KUA3_MEDTR|nr:hypothetical protein MTR_7g082130 [Medicago truncatula]